MATQMSAENLPNGPAAAALLAGGIGAFTLGLVTVIAEALVPFSNLLNFYRPTGPLSGKTMVAVAVWLFSWGILAATWKGKELNFAKVAVVAFILLALGLVFTFPPFFMLFAPRS